MGGRKYKGFVYITEEGMKTKKDFDYWIELVLDFNKKRKKKKQVFPKFLARSFKFAIYFNKFFNLFQKFLSYNKNFS